MNKKFNKLIYLILLTASLMSLRLLAFGDPGSVYMQANAAYQEKDFTKAASLYQSLTDSGYVSAEVYFNLGNSFYKTGNIASAIVNYERALKLSPDDDDIRFNLTLANLKTVDRIETMPEIFYKRWIKSIVRLMTPFGWSVLAVIFMWLFLFSGYLYLFGESYRIRKANFIMAFFSIVMAATTYFIAEKSFRETYQDRTAVIMTASAYIKSSPDSQGSDLFILHEGTKVEILDELSGWKKVKIANGSVGWLKQDDLEVI
ncbi:MAG: tetratricopeptide repeat protein [Bacteroidetes bacterium]|nr:MAG: tetratricopeptide repeat protein [Bacteroidota bacterium]REK08165.1 MAG: tetratricopeptide repeat protein [Bacteroidota bacterium]REK32370.1 MAG: tetratricopeptide repeat protein [Bacteroidota bacterium]REK49604.1 MAG: tetratricopeptide repeat protein [Bacteroidota bacterium]